MRETAYFQWVEAAMVRGPLFARDALPSELVIEVQNRIELAIRESMLPPRETAAWYGIDTFVRSTQPLRLDLGRDDTWGDLTWIDLGWPASVLVSFDRPCGWPLEDKGLLQEKLLDLVERTTVAPIHRDKYVLSNVDFYEEGGVRRLAVASLHAEPETFQIYVNDEARAWATNIRVILTPRHAVLGLYWVTPALAQKHLAHHPKPGSPNERRFGKQ